MSNTYTYTAPPPKICRVCGAVLVIAQDFMDWTQLEDHEACPNQCYSYDWEYGGTELRAWGAQRFEAQFFYNATREAQDRYSRIFQATIQQAIRYRLE